MLEKVFYKIGLEVNSDLFKQVKNKLELIKKDKDEEYIKMIIKETLQSKTITNDCYKMLHLLQEPI